MKIFLVLLLLASPVLLWSQIDYKAFPEWSLHKQDSTEYALYTPMGLQPGRKYPIVLFMHGCCGVDYHASLRNAVDPPARMWHQFGDNKQLVPTYIISPATSQGWQQHFAQLKAVMDDLVTRHQGDPQRIYVCGFSMGGMGTYQILQAYPGYFAAAIPMGMDFSGDSVKVKDIPMWMNQGETDWWSRNMRRQVASIRALNGLSKDTGTVGTTVVNPRYSNFKGVGHGVQWLAASTQDLTRWAYSKINDGNRYPVVFFEPATEVLTATAGKAVALGITATDPDGSISRIEVYINHVFNRTLRKAPYLISVKPQHGDNLIEAIAVDNKGKKNTATMIVRVNIMPELATVAVPAGRAGDYYYTKLSAKGNGDIVFSLKSGSLLPKGIHLYPDGVIKGIATGKGVYAFGVTATDADNESIAAGYKLVVTAKQTGVVLVTNIITADGTIYRLGKMQKNEAPHFNSKDSIRTSLVEEINFSGLDRYAGLSFIQTDVNDADKTAPDFLYFDADEDIVVYIAYEKLNNPVPSSIPAWLKNYKKEPGQVAAQYRYFDVYSKRFEKGRVALPAAAAKANGVSSNYFVMIKKQ